MATSKLYGACLWEEDDCRCWCQEFDPEEGDCKRCEVCHHKRGFHANTPVTGEEFVAERTYGRCNRKGKCKCQEFDPETDAPKTCDSCSHKRGFHTPEVSEHAPAKFIPLIPFVLDADGGPPSSSETPPSKKVKIEHEEGFPHDSESLRGGIPNAAAGASFLSASTQGMNPKRPPEHYALKLDQILKNKKDLTEKAGIELVLEGDKWRVQCGACKMTISVGPSTSLKNFEEHIATARHKARYEVHAGLKAEEATMQASRAEERRIAAEALRTSKGKQPQADHAHVPSQDVVPPESGNEEDTEGRINVTTRSGRHASRLVL